MIASDTLTALIAIGLTAFGIWLAFDAFATYRVRRDLERRNQRMEAEAARWGWHGARRTRERK